ncbi:hypothetical protein BCR35DRAFT_329244 [Leucosporidium creatinivorum]|uniref:Phytanoyl-CoA dioxygenase family protein n=1 Tax=Leucosporidium creatinivorum TaxID=106004 RepID=A0A1Y2FYV3_9BASI|nr:hypothetical protein BCR35DRAFT_329244 [Leucosporidium creatinivorum]
MVSPPTPQLTTLPATTPIEELVAVIKRDGGLIVSGFLTPEEVEAANAASAPFFDVTAATQVKNQDLVEMGVDFHASNTKHLRGMLGKLPEHVSKIVMHPVWNGIMHEILKTRVEAYVGEDLLVTETSHIISLAVGFNVGPGANDQVLHRDQTIHSVNAQEGSLYTSDVGCLVAGTRSTKKNGATRVVPGSHLWSPKRIPKVEEAASAEMEAGSAMFWFGSTYHGAGANTCTPGEENDRRILYGVFGCQDFLRQEENQQLVCPEEVARTLPLEVLKRGGWTKGAGGCGFVDARDPIHALGFPQHAANKALKAAAAAAVKA